MIPVGPQIVSVPDGRTGCLVARIGLMGCIEFGYQRIIETHPLGQLLYGFYSAEPSPYRVVKSGF